MSKLGFRGLIGKTLHCFGLLPNSQHYADNQQTVKNRLCHRNEPDIVTA